MKTKFYLTIIGLLFSQYLIAQTTLVAAGSSWKYLANGTDQGTAWRNASFSETGWSTGNAELGYGDGDEATCVPSGGTFVAPCNPTGSKWITTYFRKTISVAALYDTYALRVKRDDGIVVYFNGTEVYRSNMTGAVNYLTPAIFATDDGVDWQLANLASCVIPTTGSLTIAVEIHQSDASSSDISFNLELTSTNVPIALSRGPYLQMATPTSMQFRWRTDTFADSKVSFGTSAGSLTSSVTNTASVQDHIITITGLTPNTQYFYSIGSCSTTLQGTTTNFFYTAPNVDDEKKVRIWATGDCGTGNAVQTNVKNQFLSYLGSNYLDLWLLLGDNAYQSGTDEQFRDYFFGVYQNDKIMKQTVLFPAPGNHDYANTSALQVSHNMPYYDIFSLPTNAEAGGLASGTEAYYSYNYANIHFVSLDSYGYETANNYRLYDINSPQITWLKADLAANTQKWTILYWHHPPYTMGSHNSDIEGELINMRQNLVPILEQYKVDLVLCGHSHTYERSRLMKGHYGLETTFNATTQNPFTSSGRYDGSSNSCPYIKYSNATSNIGILYVVAGSAGWPPSSQPTSGQVGTFPHDAMQYSNATNGGSLYLEIEANRLDAKWIADDGVVKDQFTIMKDVSRKITETFVDPFVTTVRASWIGTYNWQTPTSSSRNIVVPNPRSGLVYYVQDTQGCLKDTIEIAGSFPCITPITMTTQVGQNSVVKYESSGTISAYSAIELGANVKFDAAKSITLSPGFTAKKGSIFKAYIDGCGNLRIKAE
jgi:acid phosphatase type 7